MISRSHQPAYTPETGQVADRHRILIVDDEPAILFAYRKLFEKEGMCVDTSSCIVDAVRRVNNLHYTAVVADVRLAGTENEDGLEFLRVLRKEHPTTLMIIATGCSSNKIETKVRALGVVHYFEKPVQPAALVAVLKNFANLQN
ncbi:MAG: response regulator [Geobacteraceae bacterium]|nr:response regulator [Geobacteraceae bacterium]